MDVRESLGLPREADETPRLDLIAPEFGRARRIPVAFVAAAALHLLLGLSVVRVGRPGRSAVEAPPPPRPTPVRVVFYETRPGRAATPPPTAELSDRTQRAQSEVAPPVPAPNRLPAAAGDSLERRPVAGGTASRPQPARPAAAARAAPEPPAPPARRLLPGADEMATTGSRFSPSLAASAADGAPGTPDLGASVEPAGLDAAIRRQGFGNRQSGIDETGSLEFDVKDFEWGPYARKIYAIVDRNWKSVIPLAARMPGVSGKVRVRFRIRRNGHIEGLELVLTSGRVALDQAALASIELSDPLPPLPPEFAPEDVGVTFGYYYNLPIDPDP